MAARLGLALFIVFMLGACSGIPTTPAGPSGPTVPVPVTPIADPITNPLSCKWRDEVGVVEALKAFCPGYIPGPYRHADQGDARACMAARIIPTTWGLQNARNVYIVDTGRPPYYQVYDYPSRWCGASPGYDGSAYSNLVGQ